MSHDFNDFHIATVEQLQELPAAILMRLQRLASVLEYPLNNTPPGMTVRTKMYGETITMSTDVAKHLIVLHRLGAL